MISEHIGTWVRGYMLQVGRWVARTGLSPNQLTLIGLGLNVLVALVIATGEYRLGGVLLLVASAFDMLDGAVARATGLTSKLGGFLDSTLDRYSEIVVYIGVLVFLLNTEDARTAAILVAVASSGALMISYARARAEAIGYTAAVGIAARPERVVLLAFCLILGWTIWALWVLAIVTHVTAITRIVHVWRAASADESPKLRN
ncbi:MAG TPA: CDP-alcohol phosphatidyltransferase family protein [Thermomicrobiales bacterium]|nr:CDP-alcohol phosphatidyltransferase family protein [Thermomicrobiales bacterium]